MIHQWASPTAHSYQWPPMHVTQVLSPFWKQTAVFPGSAQSSTVRDCRGCGCGRCTGVGVRSKAEVAIELEALACSLEEQRREKKAIRSERFVVKARLLACSLTVRDAAKPSS